MSKHCAETVADMTRAMRKLEDMSVTVSCPDQKTTGKLLRIGTQWMVGGIMFDFYDIDFIDIGDKTIYVMENYGNPDKTHAR